MYKSVLRKSKAAGHASIGLALVNGDKYEGWIHDITQFSQLSLRVLLAKFLSQLGC